MIVKELIDILRSMPQDAIVATFDDEDEICGIPADRVILEPDGIVSLNCDKSLWLRGR